VSSTPESEHAELRSLYEGKARAELAAADALAPGSDVIPWRGCLTPVVAVVKGLPGPAEASGGAAVRGPDGDAVEKVLERLGHDPAQVYFTLSRPDPEASPEAREARIRAQIEAVDAPLVIALDAEAAQDLARAYGLGSIAAGRSVRAAGRRFVACEGLEASLGDETAKRRVWHQLEAAAPEPPVF
jgi:hypothetical protein